MTPLSFLFGGEATTGTLYGAWKVRTRGARGCETVGFISAPRFGKSRFESWSFPTEVTNLSGSREWMYLYPPRPCITVCEPIKLLNDIHLARPVLLNHIQAKVASPAFVSVGMTKL